MTVGTINYMSPEQVSVPPGGWSSGSRCVVVRVDLRWIQQDAIGTIIGLLPLSAAPDAETHLNLVTTSEDNLHQPSMFPNGRWIVFASNRKSISRVAIVGSKDCLWNEPFGRMAVAIH